MPKKVETYASQESRRKCFARLKGTHNVNVHAFPPASIVVDPSIVAPDIHLCGT